VRKVFFSMNTELVEGGDLGELRWFEADESLTNEELSIMVEAERERIRNAEKLS